jgi:hypothetical protein
MASSGIWRRKKARPSTSEVVSAPVGRRGMACMTPEAAKTDATASTVVPAAFDRADEETGPRTASLIDPPNSRFHR